MSKRTIHIICLIAALLLGLLGCLGLKSCDAQTLPDIETTDVGNSAVPADTGTSEAKDQTVIDFNNLLAGLNYDDPDAVNAAMNQYNALTDDQKNQIPDYEKLLAAFNALKNSETDTGTDNDKQDSEVGDTVKFKGGSVYVSSNADEEAANRGESECSVTYTNPDGIHQYHLVSDDDAHVYGWVDAENVEGGSK